MARGVLTGEMCSLYNHKHAQPAAAVAEERKCVPSPASTPSAAQIEESPSRFPPQKRLQPLPAASVPGLLAALPQGLAAVSSGAGAVQPAAAAAAAAGAAPILWPPWAPAHLGIPLPGVAPAQAQGVQMQQGPQQLSAVLQGMIHPTAAAAAAAVCSHTAGIRCAAAAHPTAAAAAAAAVAGATAASGRKARLQPRT